MTEKMTIHKGLAELKTIQKRIDDEIGRAMFVTINKHSNTKLDGKPVSEFMSAAQDAYKSIRSLINRRDAIKQAITKSNAMTTVAIGDKTYTVAEAIDMKSAGMQNLQSLMNHIASQLEISKRNAERENGTKLDQRADEYIGTIYGNSDKKNLPDEIQTMRDNFVASQTVDVLDPIHAEKVMNELRTQIDAFMTEVDSALSVSNALTTIEVEYETM